MENQLESINRIYRCALALNNAGLTLLEKGHYRAGLETIQGSVDSLKFVFPSNDKSNTQAHLYNAEMRMQKAAKCLALAHKDDMISNDTEQAMMVSLECEYLYAGSTDTVKNLLLNVSTSHFIAARLELTDSDVSTRNPDLDSSVVLNNFAVAHMCILSKLTPEMSSYHALLSGAVRIFTLARSILVKQLPDQDDIQENLIHILSSAMVVRNTLQVAGSGYINMPIQDTMHNWNLLNSIVDELQEYTEYTSVCEQCAARAA